MAALAATLVMATSSLVAGTAAAEVYNCTPNGQVAGNYFDGMYQPNANYIGVSALITVRYGAVCDTDQSQYDRNTGAVGNFVTAWTMIADSAGRGWLQSGYLRAYGQPMVHVSQFYNPNFYGGPVTRFGSEILAGEVHRYWQQYYPDSEGEWHSNVDSTRFINTSPGVLTYGWAGYSQQFFGETRYLSSDMPGGVSYPSSFDSIQVQVSPTDWVFIPSPFLTGLNQNSRWAYNPTSSTSFDIWTQTFS